jgi:hypothetical protein
LAGVGPRIVSVAFRSPVLQPMTSGLIIDNTRLWHYGLDSAIVTSRLSGSKST